MEGLRSLARGTAWRIFFTVWLVYALHFASNVVRETYLGVALGDHLSIRVDEYLGLHPDLFRIPGRGGYIDNNPGASILGAVPYAVARPGIALLFRLKPELARPKPPTTYDDPRPNRTNFMNEMRARGLDVKLALAAASMQMGLMAPLGGAAAVVVFLFLLRRLGDRRRAMWLALLYAFGTPVFFRSAFLNQNLIIAELILGAYVALTWHGEERSPTARAFLLAGFLLGFALLCDYSAAPLLLAFGAWVLGTAYARRGGAEAMRAAGALVLGAVPPVLLLLGYQWAAFGSPFFPAQRYMPPTPFSVRGWNGMTLPEPGLLWGNLFSPLYGLLAFCPMLVLAVAAPFLRPGRDRPSRSELWLLFGAVLALYLFSSANQFAHLQFNTGVRYMVPAVPLLFLAVVPVLLRLPRWAALAAVIPTVTVSWAVSMARESVPTSLLQIFVGGFQLPFLTVLQKTAAAYAPFLADRDASPLPLFALAGVVLWFVWRGETSIPSTVSTPERTHGGRASS